MNKLLFITDQLYMPKNRNGSTLINSYLVPFLSSKFEVHYVCFGTEDRTGDLNAVMNSVSTLRVIQRDRVRYLDKLIGATLAVARGLPYQIALHQSKGGDAVVRKLCDDNNYSLILTDLHFNVLRLPKGYGKKSTVVGLPHDCLTMLYSEFLKKERNILRAFGYWFQGHLFSRYEKLYFSSNDLNLFVSPVDAEYVKKKFGLSNCAVVPNGTDLVVNEIDIKSPRKFRSSNKVSLLFLGNLDYKPNFDAVLFIVNELAPLLKDMDVNFDFLIAGAGGKALRSMVQPEIAEEIKFLGFVDDIEALYKAADIFISPLFSGAGMKNKVVEAMGMGLPVIGSKLSFHGIEVNVEENVLVAETAKSFYMQIERLKSNHELYESISVNSWKKIRGLYSWEAILSKYNVELERILIEDK